MVHWQIGDVRLTATSFSPPPFNRSESVSAELYAPCFSDGRLTDGSIAFAAFQKKPLTSSFARLPSQFAVATTPPDRVTRHISLVALRASGMKLTMSKAMHRSNDWSGYGVREAPNRTCRRSRF
jgi:hypothetical protein